jgi:hypothetical protein
MLLQAMSLAMSGLMLGLKLSLIVALPALWNKLNKWRAIARPLREAADLGTELHVSVQPELTKTEYMQGFEKLQQDLAAWAAKAVPADLKDGANMQAELEKSAQMFAALIHKANASNPQSDSPQSANPKAPPPPPTHTHTRTHTFPAAPATCLPAHRHTRITFPRSHTDRTRIAHSPVVLPLV